MNKEILKRAWHIRKMYARKFGCSVMEVTWKDCLEMASQAIIKEDRASRPLVVEQTWKETRRKPVGLFGKLVKKLTGQICFN